MKFHRKLVIGSKKVSPETTTTGRDHCYILFHNMTETIRKFFLQLEACFLSEYWAPKVVRLFQILPAHVDGFTRLMKRVYASL